MARIQQLQARRGTASAWTSANPTLAAGEPGFETDTGKVKFGDGTLTWVNLPYVNNRSNLPSYAPKQLLNGWLQDEAVYNSKSANKHKIRASAAKLAANTASFHMLALGDSTFVGYNGTAYFFKESIPYKIAQAMAKRVGTPYFTAGVQLCMVASGSVGDRWTLTGGFSSGLAGSVCLMTATSAGTATWVSPDQGTQVEFYYSNLSTNFTYQIDGATAVNVTCTGAATIGRVAVASLTNAFHTLKINAATGTTYIIAAGCTNPLIKQYIVHNLALGGARANSGTAGINYSDVTTAGLGNVTQLLTTAMGYTFDLAVCSLGNNDAFQSVAAATIITGLTTVRGYYSTVPWWFIHPPMVPATNQTIFDTLSGSFFTMCDTLDVTFFDWHEFDQGVTAYAADGLVGADSIHPLALEQQKIGFHVADCILPKPLIGVGTVSEKYRLIEAAGVYPPRPNVPAGLVEYSGADQPVDWLDGDAWDDLP